LNKVKLDVGNKILIQIFDGDKMTIRKIIICFTLLLPIVLASCAEKVTPVVGDSTATPVSTETKISLQTINDIDCVFDSVAPANVISELINVSGTAPIQQKFSLDGTTDIRVYWAQSAQDNFDLSIVNLDPAVENNFDKTITLESFIGPSSGCVDTTLNAGNYQIVVNEVKGSWQVWAEKIEYK
jgi:hypothetical protein